MLSPSWFQVLRVLPAETWLTVYRQRLVSDLGTIVQMGIRLAKSDMFGPSWEGQIRGTSAQVVMQMVLIVTKSGIFGPHTNRSSTSSQPLLQQQTQQNLGATGQAIPRATATNHFETRQLQVASRDTEGNTFNMATANQSKSTNNTV